MSREVPGMRRDALASLRMNRVFRACPIFAVALSHM